ncbi:MAG: hypothetical protein AB8F95_20065 [Bacteroidia bacterium]
MSLKSLGILTLLSAMIGLFSQCTPAAENAEKSSSTEQTSTAKTTQAAPTEMPANVKPVQFCFRKEFPYQDNSGMKDVLELILNIKGEVVNGAYNWLPAEKDQRKGVLKGRVEGEFIKGMYAYTQEGKLDSAEVIISIETNEASIRATPQSLGFNERLEKVACE